MTLRADVAKNKRSEAIPLNQAMRDILDNLSRRGLYVFANSRGQRRSKLPDKLRDYLRERDALPQDFRPLHGLRHSFASSLASSGQIDLYTLQRLLTHESPEMTARYAHLGDAALQRAAAVASKLLVEKEEK